MLVKPNRKAEVARVIEKSKKAKKRIPAKMMVINRITTRTVSQQMHIGSTLLHQNCFATSAYIKRFQKIPFLRCEEKEYVLKKDLFQDI